MVAGIATIAASLVGLLVLTKCVSHWLEGHAEIAPALGVTQGSLTTMNLKRKVQTVWGHGTASHKVTALLLILGFVAGLIVTMVGVVGLATTIWCGPTEISFVHCHDVSPWLGSCPTSPNCDVYSCDCFELMKPVSYSLSSIPFQAPVAVDAQYDALNVTYTADGAIQFAWAQTELYCGYITTNPQTVIASPCGCTTIITEKNYCGTDSESYMMAQVH